MKATGIVRRIDDLGRVVIPKEIRRTLRIKEGTPLEIFTDKEGEVILKKYSPIGELSVFAKEYAESLAQTTGMIACITDIVIFPFLKIFPTHYSIIAKNLQSTLNRKVKQMFFLLK